MDGCMCNVVLEHCRAVNGWLYIQCCLNAMQDSKWMVVCSKLSESTAGQ